MIKLRDLIVESVIAPENRISLGRVQINLEKVLPALTKTEQSKLSEMFEEISAVSTNLNTIPYTKFNHDKWALELEVLDGMIAEFKEEVVKVTKKKKELNCGPLIKAIEETLGY